MTDSLHLQGISSQDIDLQGISSQDIDLQGISSQDIDLDHLEYSDRSIRRHNLFATILLVGPLCGKLFEKNESKYLTLTTIHEH